MMKSMQECIMGIPLIHGHEPLEQLRSHITSINERLNGNVGASLELVEYNNIESCYSDNDCKYTKELYHFHKLYINSSDHGRKILMYTASEKSINGHIAIMSSYYDETYGNSYAHEIQLEDIGLAVCMILISTYLNDKEIAPPV